MLITHLTAWRKVWINTLKALAITGLGCGLLLAAMANQSDAEIFKIVTAVAKDPKNFAEDQKGFMANISPASMQVIAEYNIKPAEIAKVAVNLLLAHHNPRAMQDVHTDALTPESKTALDAFVLRYYNNDIATLKAKITKMHTIFPVGDGRVAKARKVHLDKNQNARLFFIIDEKGDLYGTPPEYLALGFMEMLRLDSQGKMGGTYASTVNGQYINPLYRLSLSHGATYLDKSLGTILSDPDRGKWAAYTAGSSYVSNNLRGEGPRKAYTGDKSDFVVKDGIFAKPVGASSLKMDGINKYIKDITAVILNRKDNVKTNPAIKYFSALKNQINNGVYTDVPNVSDVMAELPADTAVTLGQIDQACPTGSIKYSIFDGTPAQKRLDITFIS